MKIGVWNIRGFSEPLKRQQTPRSCTQRKFDVFCLLETKIPLANVDDCLKIFPHDWECTYSGSGLRSRIILLWRKDKVVITNLDLHSQVISCFIQDISNTNGGYFSFVYASPYESIRGRLWAKLRDLNPSSPWLLAGDFNSTLHPNERSGKRVSATACSAFASCVSDLDIHDLPATGCHLTWTNRRTDDDAMFVKLDRAMHNQSWTSSFPFSRVHFHEPFLSDHSLIEVSTADALPHKPRPFKFVNA